MIQQHRKLTELKRVVRQSELSLESVDFRSGWSSPIQSLCGSGNRETLAGQRSRKARKAANLFLGGEPQQIPRSTRTVASTLTGLRVMWIAW